MEVYVLNEGSGTVSVIDTTTDAVVAILPAGTSPVHMVVDKQFNRLYVVDGSSSNNLWIFDASVDPPVALKTLTLPLANPTSITVLANGLKAYVPSQQITAPALNALCPVKTIACALSVVSVAIVNTTNNTVRSTVSLTSPVQQVCNPGNVLFTETGGVRFRAFATSSSNSNRVYISSCDAGVIHSLNTTNDSLVTELAAPISSFAPLSATTPPPPQQPVFVLPGP